MPSHLPHTLPLACGPFLVCAVVCGPRGGPYVVCGLMSYRISPRSPEANARVSCESGCRRLHLSARIPVPPLLLPPSLPSQTRISVAWSRALAFGRCSPRPASNATSVIEHEGHHIASYNSIPIPDYISGCSNDKSIMQILLLSMNKISHQVVKKYK
jgi:hypothetical protein